MKLNVLWSHREQGVGAVVPLAVAAGGSAVLPFPPLLLQLPLAPWAGTGSDCLPPAVALLGHRGKTVWQMWVGLRLAVVAAAGAVAEAALAQGVRRRHSGPAGLRPCAAGRLPQIAGTIFMHYTMKLLASSSGLMVSLHALARMRLPYPRALSTKLKSILNTQKIRCVYSH